MAENVDLFIFPAVQEGEDELKVKERLVKTLKVDEDTVNAWFASAEPTRILHDVGEDVADRYVKAIQKCGAECNTDTTGNESLSLMPKTVHKSTLKFICPSCEYEEDRPAEDGLPEQCPKCGLVLSKWEERLAEEAEKEKIRRRLLREARLREDGQDELDARRKELERIRALEREIMKELGLKPPGKFWIFFEQHPFPVALAILGTVVLATGFVFKTFDTYTEQEEREALIAAAPSEEIQTIAPVVSAAVQLQQLGKEGVIEEIAEVNQKMRGEDNAARTAIVKAAQQMMKGAEPEKFIAMAGQLQHKNTSSQPISGGSGSIPVNVDSMGGVTGLTGAASFDARSLASILPQSSEDGHQALLDVFSTQRSVLNPLNPEGPRVFVDEIDELDGSMIVDLMTSLAVDAEWDSFLGEQVRLLLDQQAYDKATELADRIRQPADMIKAHTDIMASQILDGDTVAAKLSRAKIRLELEEIADVDSKAELILWVGNALSAAGSKDEPAESIAMVEEMVADSRELFDKAILHSKLAVAYMYKGDKAKARLEFGRAMTTAGQISDTSRRLSAFIFIGQRQFDARNTTLASEIISEAEVLAATQLSPEERSIVFAQIAIARAYMGDFVGAEMALANASTGDARQQLLSKIAQMLIANDRYFQAMAVLEGIEDPVAYTRLWVSIITNYLYSNRLDEAAQGLQQAIPRARRIKDPGKRGLLLSQLARLAYRTGDAAQGSVLFREALDNSDVLQGRKKQINRGLVALDKTRVFLFEDGRDTLNGIEDILIKDPIGNELMATERTIKLLLPQFMPSARAG